MTDKPETAREFAGKVHWFSQTHGVEKIDELIAAHDAELKAQTAAMLEKVAKKWLAVCKSEDFDSEEHPVYLVDSWEDHANELLALIPTDYAAALADREAEIHHGYQCGETYARLVSAQVDSIVAERVREATQQKGDK